MSSSLDLSETPPPPAKPPPVAVRPRRPQRRTRQGADTILRPNTPTVTLTRVQSGVGALTIDAACSDAVGDVRLGCAYQLRSGHASTVQRAGSSRLGPRDSSRPVITGSRERFERLTIDLRQSRELERMLVYAFSESRGSLNWDGTLLVTTFGGASIEIPLARPASSGVLAVMSLYNVHGEYVLRAELDEYAGSVRDACNAYGYERITWLDDRTPLE